MVDRQRVAADAGQDLAAHLLGSGASGWLGVSLTQTGRLQAMAMR